MRKKVIILGAGISGLATAWYLSKTGHNLDTCILEKTSRCGGWLHTEHTSGFHFEKGPRTFKVDKCPSTVQLIAELGLQDEIIWSYAKPHHRYLWFDNELHRFPTNPLSFLLSPITKGFIRALMNEWRVPVKNADETVWEFARRRFNDDVARLFFDPMVVGIFGGDVRKISMRACFPKLKEWEEKYGSVTKGFYKAMQKKKKESAFSPTIPGLPLSAMFSFRQGLQQLPQAISRQIPATIHYNQEVKEIVFQNDQILVKTDKEDYVADFLFCALPIQQTAQLFESHVPDICKEFAKVHSQGVAVMNFGYDASVLPVQGFGYLTPTYAGEDILGVVFDSSVFTEHNRKPNETRLTIKMHDMGRTEDQYIQSALHGIRRHLGVSRTPSAISFKLTKNAIPQYAVGHLDAMAQCHARFRGALPSCELVGNYLQGVSVDSCIANAKEVVLNCATKWGAENLSTCR